MFPVRIPAHYTLSTWGGAFMLDTYIACPTKFPHSSSSCPVPLHQSQPPWSPAYRSLHNNRASFSQNQAKSSVHNISPANSKQWHLAATSGSIPRQQHTGNTTRQQPTGCLQLGLNTHSCQPWQGVSITRTAHEVQQSQGPVISKPERGINIGATLPPSSSKPWLLH